MNRRDLAIGCAALTAAAFAPRAAAAQAPGRLSNPTPSAEAKALYRYLWDIWGKKTLTGQQESTWRQPDGPRYELNYIEQVSGKLPAVLGLDYIDPADRGGVNHRATQWYAEGGIPTLCWHWGNPLIGPGYEQSKLYFNAVDALQDGTKENTALLRDMTEIAGWLTALRDAGVPVLWRPLHEFTGDWFWWGKCGPEVFKALWIKMYKFFTHEHGLNNLIWVLGYTRAPDPAWFPGSQYVDIIGADNYVKDTGPMKDMYDAVRKVSGDRFPIALHECGPIPDPDQLTASGANWLYFLVWHSEFIHDGKTNPPEWIKTVYNCERYVTRDELPALKTYGA